MTGEHFHVVSMVDTAKTVVAITVMYGLLAWYFDQTLEHNRGDPKPWYFPVDPNYWFPFLRLGTQVR